MKKIKTIILGIFVIGILVTNLSIIGSKNNKILGISLSSFINASATDIEEVVIVCSTGGQGRCYKSDGNKAYWCVNYWMFIHGCDATGNVNDNCAKVACVY